MNSMHRWLLCCFATLLPVAAQAQGIFSCTDASGRRITSDRPIAECMDRDQMELSDSGRVKRVIKPSMTAKEREAFEEKINQELAEQNRKSEERRKDRALVARYPNQTAHDRERKEAISGLEAATVSAQNRLTSLRQQSKKLDEEMEFYKKDPSKVPGRLKQLVKDTNASIEAQLRFLDGQKEEEKRINLRFDQELEKLRTLWGTSLAGTSPSRTTPTATPLAAPRK